MKNERRLKNKECNYKTIKITKIREVYSFGNGAKRFEDVMFCAKIDDGWMTTSYCKDTLKELKEALMLDI